MGIQRKSDNEHFRSRAAILDLLANRLNCDRSEVNFLFGQSAESLNSESVGIPDVRIH